MYEVVYNELDTTLRLSREAISMLKEMGVSSNLFSENSNCYLPRHDPRLISVIKKLGVDKAGIGKSDLRIATITSNKYCIQKRHSDDYGYYSYEEVIEFDETEWITIE